LRQIKLSPFGQENVRKETIDGSISVLPKHDIIGFF